MQSPVWKSRLFFQWYVNNGVCLVYRNLMQLVKLPLSQQCINATEDWCYVIWCQEVYTERLLVGISLLAGSLHHTKKKESHLLKTLKTSSATWWCLRLYIQCHSDGYLCLKDMMVGFLSSNKWFWEAAAPIKLLPLPLRKELHHSTKICK